MHGDGICCGQTLATATTGTAAYCQHDLGHDECRQLCDRRRRPDAANGDYGARRQLVVPGRIGAEHHAVYADRQPDRTVQKTDGTDAATLGAGITACARITLMLSTPPRTGYCHAPSIICRCTVPVRLTLGGVYRDAQAVAFAAFWANT